MVPPPPEGEGDRGRGRGPGKRPPEEQDPPPRPPRRGGLGGPPCGRSAGGQTPGNRAERAHRGGNGWDQGCHGCPTRSQPQGPPGHPRRPRPAARGATVAGPGPAPGGTPGGCPRPRARPQPARAGGQQLAAADTSRRELRSRPHTETAPAQRPEGRARGNRPGWPGGACVGGPGPWAASTGKRRHQPWPHPGALHPGKPYPAIPASMPPSRFAAGRISGCTG